MAYELINDETAEVLFITEFEAMNIKDTLYLRYEDGVTSVFVGDSRFESMREMLGGDFLMKYYDWFNRK